MASFSQFIRDFLRRCRLRQEEPSGPGSQISKAWRILSLAFRGLGQHRSWLQASTLAYATILALIPLMALLFALLKGLGIQRLLATHLMDRLAPGSHEFALQILKYIETTQVTSLGVFGVVWLLAALMILMNTVEQAFNGVWNLTRTRTWRRKLSDYLSIFLMFPIFMAVAISISSGILSQPDIRNFLSGILPEFLYSATTSLISLGLLWMAFTFINLVMPNTSVRFVSALLGGVVGGSLWQLAHYIFTWFQGAATYYNAIYGALYHLLFLVIWMFWSWLIVLFSAEVTTAHQNLDRLTQEMRRPTPTPGPVDEYLALAALVAISQRYARRQPLLTLEELHQTLASGDFLAARVVEVLKQCDLVLEMPPDGPQDSPRYLPAMPPDQIRVKEVLDCLRQARGMAVGQALGQEPHLEAMFQSLTAYAPASPWDGLSLQELVRLLETPPKQ